MSAPGVATGDRVPVGEPGGRVRPGGDDLRRCPHCGKPKPPIHWYRSGKTRCRIRFFWSQARLWELMELIERGQPDEQIARHFGTTPEAINLARKRHAIPSRRETFLSANKIAQRMGFGCGKKVTWLIEQGWLKGRRGQGAGRSRQWYVKFGDLLAFLAAPEHRHLWDPDRITDPVLRAFAARHRGDERYLTQADVAVRCYVEPGTVAQWMDKGWLPFVRSGHQNRTVRESDLAAFRRPGLVRQRAVVEAIATLRRRGLNLADIAQLYGTQRTQIGELAGGEREPLAAVAERFALLVRETAHLPESDALAFGKHPPIPGFDDLVARVRPLVQAIPLRSGGVPR